MEIRDILIIIEHVEMPIFTSSELRIIKVYQCLLLSTLYCETVHSNECSWWLLGIINYH